MCFHIPSSKIPPPPPQNSLKKPTRTTASIHLYTYTLYIYNCVESDVAATYIFTQARTSDCSAGIIFTKLLRLPFVTRSHQLSLNLQPPYCAIGKSSHGGLSGCFQIFARLKSISIKLWCICTDML